MHETFPSCGLSGRLRVLTGSFVVFAAFSFCLLFPTEAQGKERLFRGLVVGVSDGDTIKVMRDGAPQTVRLNFIDCPEKKQDFGQVARSCTATLCFKRTVLVKESGRDRYNRSLAEVVLPDRRVLNLELVKRGYAWWYEQYAPKAVEYKLAQAKARDGRKGLWQQSRPLPPWQFRKEARQGSVRLAQR